MNSTTQTEPKITRYPEAPRKRLVDDYWLRLPAIAVFGGGGGRQVQPVRPQIDRREDD